MATPDPPPESGTVTVASQGAAAFVGDVYYLADGRTGDPILGWPPRPPNVGFSRGDARDWDDGPDAFGMSKARREGERVLLATNAADADRALRRFRDACFPSSDADREKTPASDEKDAVASLASAAAFNRRLGPSAYFPDPAFAARWGEVVNRPCGLSYRACARRRLRRPSDKPLLPHGVVVRAAPFARAYANLTVGWNNAALAAKRGVAVGASARRAAADVFFLRSDIDAGAVMGANPEIAGDGAAEALAPLLTGYEGFLPFAPFEGSARTHASASSGARADGGASRARRGDERRGPRLSAWLVDELSMCFMRIEESNKPSSASLPKYPAVFESCESWRAAAARAEGADAAGTDSNPDVRARQRKRKDDTANLPELFRRLRYRGFDDRLTDSMHELFDRLIAARAADRESVSVGECPRPSTRRPRASERPPADAPVFSSPVVHVVAPADESAFVAELSSPRKPFVASTDDDPTLDAASTYPLGVKLAVSDEATGRVAVTGSHVYRPWFFELEDLRKMVRAAIKAEAEARVARNRARREKTNRALAALLTAVCHTKPNPRLSGFRIPGLDGANRGAGGKGSGGVPGGVSLGGGDDDDDEDDDDDDPRNEGLEDDDDGSLNDDDLMKEYMREMVKDGTAEDALGAWARDAARAAKEARESAAKGLVCKRADDADDTDSAFRKRRWMPGFLRKRSDERDTYQQLDVSPAAHFGLVLAVTAYYAWNASRAFCGDALDRAFLKTNLGRWTLVIDTPLADAMEHVEVGSFEGVCASAVAEAAGHDVSRRYDARVRARSAAAARAQRDVASAAEATRRARADEETRLASFERERDALAALEDERESRRRWGGKGDDELEKASGGEGVKGIGEGRRVVKAFAPRGGPLRAVPLLRRIPKIGARRDGNDVATTETGRAENRKRVTERDDDELERDVAAATRAREEAHAAWLAARDRATQQRRAETDALSALTESLSEDARDIGEKVHFLQATRDALARAERARAANKGADLSESREQATQKDPPSKVSDVSGEASREGPSSSAEEPAGGDAANETAATERAPVLFDVVSAPPLFVANLPDGNTLGDGTQAVDDGSGARLRGFVGTGKVRALT